MLCVVLILDFKLFFSDFPKSEEKRKTLCFPGKERNMTVTAEQRREEIIAEIQSKGRVKVSDLSLKYGISEVSIRNDLELLEAQGHLSRIHGGAVGLNKLYSNMDLNERYTTNATAKKELAAFIADLVEDNDTIMMNAGTTLTYVLRALQGKKNISIVTNSIQNATEASTYPTFNVILLGGQIDSKYQFTHGQDAVKQLENYHATKSILSVDGITPSTGLTLYYTNEASLVRKMTELSEQVIIVADNSKIGKNTFARICSISNMDVLVTNRSEKRTDISNLKEAGVTVYEV